MNTLISFFDDKRSASLAEVLAFARNRGAAAIIDDGAVVVLRSVRRRVMDGTRSTNYYAHRIRSVPEAARLLSTVSA